MGETYLEDLAKEENIIQALSYVAKKGKDVILIEYAENRDRVGESLRFKIFVEIEDSTSPRIHPSTVRKLQSLSKQQ